ncbi:hypothetical protein J6590_092645, partial [Homalodisca vitripennis]
ITCIHGKAIEVKVNVTSNATIGDSIDNLNITTPTNRTLEGFTAQDKNSDGELKTRQLNSIEFNNWRNNYFKETAPNLPQPSRYDQDQNKQYGYLERQLEAQDSNNHVVHSNVNTNQQSLQYKELNKKGKDKTVHHSENYRKHLEDLYGIKGVSHESNTDSQGTRLDSLNSKIHSRNESTRNTWETEEILSKMNVYGNIHKNGNQKGNTIGSTNNKVQTGQTQNSFTNNRDDYTKNMFESSEMMQTYWDQINNERLIKEQNSEREKSNVNHQHSQLFPGNQNGKFHSQQQTQTHDTSFDHRYETSEEKRLWEIMQHNKEHFYKHTPGKFENNNQPIKHQTTNEFFATHNHNKQCQEQKKSHDTSYNTQYDTLWETKQNNEGQFFKYPNPNDQSSNINNQPIKHQTGKGFLDTNNDNRQYHFQEHNQSHHTSKTQHMTTNEQRIWEINNNKEGRFDKYPFPRIEHISTQPIFQQYPKRIQDIGDHKIKSSSKQKTQAQQSTFETQRETSNEERFWQLINNNNEGKYVKQSHVNGNINEQPIIYATSTLFPYIGDHNRESDFHEQKQSTQDKSESWHATSKDTQVQEFLNNNNNGRFVNIETNNVKYQPKFSPDFGQKFVFGNEKHDFKNHFTTNQHKSNTKISHSKNINELMLSKLNYLSQNNEGESSASVQKMENESSNKKFNIHEHNINSNSGNFGREISNVKIDFDNKNIFDNHHRNKFMTNTTNTSTKVSGFDKYNEEYDSLYEMQGKSKEGINCTGNCKNDQDLLKNMRRFKTHLRETYL